MSNQHSNEAIALLGSAEKAYGPEIAQMLLKSAQVQASLAVAYEQRTANLIAWVAAHGEDPSWVTVQIQERLGLA
jgi:DICT domain-containing protein